jgi:hypothetical protein
MYIYTERICMLLYMYLLGLKAGGVYLTFYPWTTTWCQSVSFFFFFPSHYYSYCISNRFRFSLFFFSSIKFRFDEWVSEWMNKWVLRKKKHQNINNRKKNASYVDCLESEQRVEKKSREKEIMVPSSIC